MRMLIHPGAPVQPRAQVVPGRLARARGVLRPGRTLNAALAELGLAAGTARFAGTVMAPFRYVTSWPSPDGSRAAWYSPTREHRHARMIDAVATLGSRDGAPFIHCHAMWENEEGALRGGHILPLETFIAAESAVEAVAVEGARITVAADTETNFSLFMPEAAEPSPDAPDAPDALAVRLRPNQDIHAALAALVAARGWREAVVHGIGSLVNPRFADGRAMADDATEILIQDGRVRDGVVTLEGTAVDMSGRVFSGVFAPGENAVCITCELVVERAG